LSRSGFAKTREAPIVKQKTLKRLHDAGQSVWLDYIDRSMLHDGDLDRRIRDDALTGMTTNPTMFERALAKGTAYDDQIRVGAVGAIATELLELLATTDVRDACDLFRPVFERTDGADGYVSIEVSPDLAYKLDASVAAASRLWATVDRPNLMIKVPGTIEGSVAVRELTAAGINVNITLLFSTEMHQSVIDAYMGLEDRLAAGKPLADLHSVASFFVSRVDVQVDRRLQDRERAGSIGRDMLRALLGQTGIAKCQARLPALSEGILEPAMEPARAVGREPLAAAVGQHWGQGSGISRRHVRRTADRERHGRDDAAPHHGCVSRSRRRRLYRRPECGSGKPENDDPCGFSLHEPSRTVHAGGGRDELPATDSV
jgi:transaldolase